MNKSCCPSCGSKDAVSKSVAWDAAMASPPGMEKKVEQLTATEDAARSLFAAMMADPDRDGSDCVYLLAPHDELVKLAETIGLNKKDIEL